jgi:hypothetical protein
VTDERRLTRAAPQGHRGARRTFFALAVAAITVLAVVVNSPLVGNSTERSRREPGPCRQVLFQGARGSGQPSRGDARDGNTGLGQQVYTVYQSLAAGSASVAVNSIGPRYKSLNVDWLAPGLNPLHYAARVADWFRDLNGGVNAAYAALVSRSVICPNERIVLVGYSQGAMLEHRVIAKLAVDHETKILRRIVGVVLIGDPDRARHSASQLDGDPAAGKGGRGIAAAHGLAPEGDLPPSIARVTTNVCTKDDIVCDWRSMPWELLHWRDAINRHTSYGAALLTPLGHELQRLATPA